MDNASSRGDRDGLERPVNIVASLVHRQDDDAGIGLLALDGAGRFEAIHGRKLTIWRKRYGRGRWRKLKGDATVRLADGSLRRAEIHWYEAHGVGKKGLKIKRFLD
jgi:hypothetical protein